MVNIGRSSTGCRTCRARRIKCDERRPICQKCEISNRVCSGYRTEMELRFRPVQVARDPSHAQLASRDSRQRQPQINFVPPSLPTDPDSVALACFMRMFVLPRAQLEEYSVIDTAMGPLLAVIEPLYVKSLSSGPSIPAILAIAWATSSPFVGAAHCMREAKKKSVEAISRLRAAIQDPSTAKRDDTLLAVLLLAWIENITATPQSLPQTVKHINGAIALVNLRGKQNFANKWAKTLLSFIRFRLNMNPINHNAIYQPLSDEVKHYESQAEVLLTESEHPRSESARMAPAFFSLRADINSLLGSSPQPVSRAVIESILRRVLMFNQRLTEWRASLPQAWETLSIPPDHIQRERLNNPVSADATSWLGSNATYPTLHIAELINKFRLHQIGVQLFTAKCCTRIIALGEATVHTGADDATEIAKFHDILKEAQQSLARIVLEICASVPFHLGTIVPSTTSPRSTEPGSAPEADHTVLPNPALQSQGKSIPPPHPVLPHTPPSSLLYTSTPAAHQAPMRKNMGCYMIMQPLLVISAIPRLPDLQKRWILNQALEICRFTGMDAEMITRRFQTSKGPAGSAGPAGGGPDKLAARPDPCRPRSQYTSLAFWMPMIDALDV